MNLNKETALRLWTQQFGKRQKAHDFAGRGIEKAAAFSTALRMTWIARRGIDT